MGRKRDGAGHHVSSGERINESCISFDPTDRIDLEQDKPLFAGIAKQKCRTDCHGKHRLAKPRTKGK